MSSYTPHPVSWTALDYANHLWQSTLVALVLLGVLALCARLSARTRVAIIWLALGKFALPLAAVSALFAQFFLRSPSPHAATPPALPLASSHDTSALAGTGIAPSLFPLVIPLPASFGPAFLVIWLAGLTLYTGIWSVRALRARALLLTGAGPLPASLDSEIVAAVALAGLRATPRCLATDSIHGPALVGLFSPVIVLPRSLVARLTPAELQAILLHEFVHLRRRDHLWSALQSLWIGLLWFHPVAWLLDRRLRLETEKSCDERVIELTADPETYASGIVKTVRHTLGLEAPGVSGVTTPPVLNRLRAILAPRPRRHRHALHLVAFAVALSLTILGTQASTALARVTAAEPPRASVDTPTSVNSAPPELSTPRESAPTTALTPTTGSDSVPTPLAAVTPAADKKSPDDETMSIEFLDTEIREVLAHVAELYQINLVMPESLQGRTTVKLTDVTWRQVFKAVLEPKGFTFLKEGNIIRITPLASAPRTTPGAK